MGLVDDAIVVPWCHHVDARSALSMAEGEEEEEDEKEEEEQQERKRQRGEDERMRDNRFLTFGSTTAISPSLPLFLSLASELPLS